MNFRILREADAQLYREIRLHSLQTNPEAFSTTYQTEVARPLEITLERLKPSEDKFTLGCFNDEGVLVGIVRFARESDEKLAHKGNVYGMYVHPLVRRQGIGKALLQELIRRAREYDGLEQINLSVVCSNGFAKKLYQSLGFEVYGTEQNALKAKGQYFDEDLMVLPLNRK